MAKAPTEELRGVTLARPEIASDDKPAAEKSKSPTSDRVMRRHVTENGTVVESY